MEHAAHLLPMQGPIGVFVHHNTLHAFEHLSFEEAVIQAAQLFGAEPYMSEAAYRAELARGRIQLVDIDAVLDREPDSFIFARLSRSSLRRAMITPGRKGVRCCDHCLAHRTGRFGQRLSARGATRTVRGLLCPHRGSRGRTGSSSACGRRDPPLVDPALLCVLGSRHGLLAHAEPREGVL